MAMVQSSECLYTTVYLHVHVYAACKQYTVGWLQWPAEQLSRNVLVTLATKWYCVFNWLRSIHTKLGLLFTELVHLSTVHHEISYWHAPATHISHHMHVHYRLMWMGWSGFATLVLIAPPWKLPRMIPSWSPMPDYSMKGEYMYSVDWSGYISNSAGLESL